MALLTLQTIVQAGIIPSSVAGAASNTFPNNGKTFLSIYNNSGYSLTVAVDSLNNCDQGFDHNLSITIASGATKFIGPFEINRFNNVSGLVTVTLSATSLTGVTIAAISL